MPPQPARTVMSFLLRTFVCLLYSSILVQAKDECQPVTWRSKRDLKAEARAVQDAGQMPPLPDQSVNFGPNGPKAGQLVCHMYLPTKANVNYFTCTELAEISQNSVGEFFALNPTLKTDCSNIKPLNWYCVDGHVEPLRAWDGKCGPPNKNATCAGTGLGCCNSKTWTCGNAFEDCANGICYEGDCPGHAVFSTDGKCGADHEFRQCAGDWGECCSIHGECGFGNDFCGPNVCSFGNCTVQATRPPTGPAQLPWTFGNSTDGSCGPANGFTCGVTNGNCCNKDGLCGSLPADCGQGCQPLYGKCNDMPPTLKEGWNVLGCYKDLYPANDRILQEIQPIDDSLTVERCQTTCFVKGYKFSGVEDGRECWCGNGIQVPSANIAVSMSDCSKSCPGKKSQKCGAGARAILSQFSSPTQASWTMLGCYKDLYPAKKRTLQEQQTVQGDLTVASCRNICASKQYKYSGVEDGRECWCGDDIQDAKDNNLAAVSECSKPCPGNNKESCGASARITLSQLTPATQPSWEVVGCYKDTFPAQARTLKELVRVDGDLTIEGCRKQCYGNGYVYSGMEDGRECWCGNVIQSSATNTLTALSECSKGCPGDKTQTCGNGGRIFISRYVDPSQSTWNSLGCYKDKFPTTARTLKERVDVNGATTIENCRERCQSKGYHYSGVEDGWECWCGNEIQSPFDNSATEEANCNKACSGDKNQNCGASGFVSLSKLS